MEPSKILHRMIRIKGRRKKRKKCEGNCANCVTSTGLN
ncbi:hypothetical protein BVRB_2g040110 [Beta vulgaris subsp. vulgaris]|nr:hypothetical protein BVRB_2g040110 [Beta vulgaris subsp. vulgaris]